MTVLTFVTVVIVLTVETVVTVVIVLTVETVVTVVTVAIVAIVINLFCFCCYYRCGCSDSNNESNVFIPETLPSWLRPVKSLTSTLSAFVLCDVVTHLPSVIAMTRVRSAHLQVPVCF